MAAYTMLLNLIKEYFIDLGYEHGYISTFFSEQTFKEIAVVCLANANVMIKNKTDHSSHQTHIAITGEMIDFFCPWNEFDDMDTTTIRKSPVVVSKDNLKSLKNLKVIAADAKKLELIEGSFTWGKRTQNQLQLSKKNTQNSSCFNELRLGLYENDLLFMLKFRDNGKIMAIGIPQTYYLDVMPGFRDNYETNTYLILPYRR